MNLKRIDAAIAAYQTKADASDLARLDFFRGIWEIQARIADRVSESADLEVPDSGTLASWYWACKPFLSQAPVQIDADLFAWSCAELAEYVCAKGSLPEPTRELLRGTDWESLIATAGVDVAGSSPASFLASVSTADDVVGMILSLALRPMLEPAQRAFMKASRSEIARGLDEHDKPLLCPVCGCEAGVGYVGPTQGCAGNGRTLSCTQCGCTWEVERIRCVRCGTRSQTRLRYRSLAGDDVHRMHCCSECGGYLRTFFADSKGGVTFVPEVEDVMMARLDAAAADPDLWGDAK